MEYGYWLYDTTEYVVKDRIYKITDYQGMYEEEIIFINEKGNSDIADYKCFKFCTESDYLKQLANRELRAYNNLNNIKYAKWNYRSTEQIRNGDVVAIQRCSENNNFFYFQGYNRLCAAHFSNFVKSDEFEYLRKRLELEYVIKDGKEYINIHESLFVGNINKFIKILAKSAHIYQNKYS